MAAELTSATPTVLILEADEQQRAAATELLQLGGYEVRSAADGWAGLALARQHAPRLLLCAVQLPGLDGYGLLHLLRQDAALQTIPVIMTGPPAPWPEVRQAMELGADDYLPTPFEAGRLLRAVAARLLRFRPQPGAAEEAPLAGPPSESLHALVAGRTPQLVPRRQQLYAEGDEPRYLYYVQLGRVKTIKTTSFGKELVTGFYHRGEFFGYKALLERAPHHEAAVAVEDSALLCVPAAEFWQQLQLSEASQQLVRLLVGRKREREAQLLDMAYHSLRRRVANALLNLHDHAAAAGTNPVYIQLAREDLASLVGITPESLSRTLSEFRHDQLLESTAQGIRLLQLDYLRRAEW